MIAVSIAALSLALLTTPHAVATVSSGLPEADTNALSGPARLVGLPHIGMPKVPLPRLRMPRLPKRSGDTEALGSAAKRLTAMVAQQESWYSDHGTYRSHGAALTGGPAASDANLQAVQVQVIFAGRKGWTAIASHPDAPGKSCVIYVGNRSAIPIIPRTRADAAEAAAEAKPVCDR